MPRTGNSTPCSTGSGSPRTATEFHGGQGNLRANLRSISSTKVDVVAAVLEGGW